MAETSGPFDGTALAEADWELMLQHVIHGVTGTPGGSQLFASATGTRGVAVTAGSALVRGHWYKSDATVTLTSSSNGASTSRIDRRVLRLNRSTNTVVQAVIEGTAGSGLPPTPADNATTTEVPIWRWTVAPSATSVTAITDERPWLGSLVVPCTSTNRPLSPINGTIGREMNTGKLIMWTGSAWQTVFDDTGLVTITVTGNWKAGGLLPQIKCVGSAVYLRGSIERTVNTLQSTDTNSQFASIGSPFLPVGNHTWSHLTATASPVRLNVSPAGALAIVDLAADIPVGRQVYIDTMWMIGS